MAESPKDGQPREVIAPPPSPWPHYLMLVFGVVSIVAAGYTWGRVSDQSDKIAALQVTLENSETAGADDDTLRALLRSQRDLTRIESTWKRRRLGFFILAAILILGGFFASGLHGLHSKMVWQERDAPDDDWSPRR